MIPIQYYCPEVTLEMLVRMCPVRQSFLNLMLVDQSIIQVNNAKISVGISLFNKDVNDATGRAPGDLSEFNQRYKSKLAMNFMEIEQSGLDLCVNLFVDPLLKKEAVGFAEQFEFLNVHIMKESSHGASGLLWRFLTLDDRFDCGADLCYSVDADDPVLTVMESLDGFGPCRALFFDEGHNRCWLRELDARLYTPVMGGMFRVRNKDVDFDVAQIVARFFDYQCSWQHIAEPRTEYNRGTVSWPMGFGNTWNRYGTDERFLAKVLYYHLTRKGSLNLVCSSKTLEADDDPFQADKRFTLECENSVFDI